MKGSSIPPPKSSIPPPRIELGIFRVLLFSQTLSERLITLHSMLVKNLQFTLLIFPGNHKTEMCQGFVVFPKGNVHARRFLQPDALTTELRRDKIIKFELYLKLLFELQERNGPTQNQKYKLSCRETFYVLKIL